jgi:hypothetical protein
MEKFPKNFQDIYGIYGNSVNFSVIYGIYGNYVIYVKFTLSIYVKQVFTVRFYGKDLRVNLREIYA